MPEKKQIIGIYHKDCIDGTSAAAVMLRKFPSAHLFPLSHTYTASDIEPIINLAEVESEVFTLDCALGLQELLENGNAVTVIDHHAGSREVVEHLVRDNPKATYIFDNDKSGASLSWSYFFPNEKERKFINYVEDADLWIWKYGDETKHVNNYLSMFRNDPKTMLEILEGDLQEVKARGAIISQSIDSEIANLVKLASINIKIEEYIVPAYNITVHESAVGNILSEKFGKAVAIFIIIGDAVKLSFRSKEHHSPSALVLAQLLSGGGHKCASGATIPRNDFIKMIQ